MPWYAVEAIDDAMAAARTFLFPFDLRRWLTLAVIVFFFGWGGSSASGTTSNVSNVASGVSPGMGEIPDIVGLIVIAVIIALLVVGIFLAAIGAVMRFVFVDVLRTGDVRIVEPFKRWLWPGLRLFGFAFGLLLLVGAPVVLLLVGTFTLGIGPAVLAVLLPFAILGALGLGVVVLLTYEFVVPTMMLGEGRVIVGWQRFWTTLRGQWKQFAVYVIVRWILGLVVGILAAVALGIVALPFLLVFGLLVGVGYLVGIGLSPALLVVLAVIGVPVAIVLFTLAMFVQVVVQTYFGYYALLVLGDVDPDLDLIPDRRAAVREPDAGTAGPTGG